MTFLMKRCKGFGFLWLGMILVFSIPADASEQASNKRPLSVKKINTIIVDNYYPYTFVNKNGDADGFSVDLMKDAAKIMGMELEIGVDTWEQAKSSLVTGKIDFLPMMAYSKERDRIFDFSVPHTIAYDAFFIRETSNKISTIDDLKGKSVIVMKDDQAHDYLRSTHLVEPEKLLFIDSIPDALRLLASGRGDAALMPKLVGLIVLKDLGLTNLEDSPLVIEAYSRPFSFAVKEGNQPLLERLNQGLSIVKETGRYGKIYDKWFGALEPKELPFKAVFKYILLVFVALVFLGLALTLWSISLRKQVAVRTRDLEDEIFVRKRAEEARRESESFVRSIMDNLPIGIAVNSVDPAVTFEYMNDNFPKFYRTTREALTDPDAFWDAVYEEADLREEMKKRVLNDCAGGEQGRMYWPDVPVSRKGEDTSFITAQNIPIPEKGLMISTVWDVTARKLTEEALRDSERLLNEVGKIAKIGGWEMDLTTRKAKWTQGTYDIVEIDYDQPIPGLDEHVGYYLPEYRSLVSDSMQALVEDDRPLDFEAQLRTAKGNIKWCRAIGRAIKKEGLGIKVYGTFQDITDRKRAEEEIRALNRDLELRVHQRTAQLEESNKELEDFVYSVSHDLRAPLRSISGFAEIIDRRHKASLNEEGQHYFDNIVKASKQMGELIDDLLKFSRLGRKAIKPEAVPLDDVFKTAVEILSDQIEKTEAHVDIPEQMPVIQGDVTLATHIFINLLENAVKYHKPNEPPRIDVRFEIKDQTVVVSIADNGIGIEPVYHEKIFNIFQRLHSQADYPGTGIGLAAVRKAAQIMGGRVWVESELGKGSVFKIKVLMAMTA